VRETLVRVHEPLSVLDILEVGRGEHSWSFARAMQAIAAAEPGVIVLLNLGESPADLLDRFQARAGAAPAPAAARAAKLDLRTYGIGAQILRDLDVGRMRLMARPRKMPSMAGFGLQTIGYLEDRGDEPAAGPGAVGA